MKKTLDEVLEELLTWDGEGTKIFHLLEAPTEQGFDDMTARLALQRLNNKLRVLSVLLEDEVTMTVKAE